MFRIQASPSYRFPVTATIRAESGVIEQHRFHLLFKRFDDEQLEGLMARINDGASDKDTCLEVVVGFGDDVGDANGNPIPFTPEALAELLAMHGMKGFVVRAFFESLSTEQTEVARAKNSETPPATGCEAATVVEPAAT